MTDIPRTRPERWPKRGAGNRLEPECWPVLKPSFQIEAGASIFAIGSCFARNIERHLFEMGFYIPTINFLNDNPDLHPALNPDALNKFTPPSIYQELAWTRQILDRDDCVRMEDIESFLYTLDDGNVLDLQRRPANQRGTTPEEALRLHSICYKLFRHAFTCDVAIITLGYVECWLDTEKQAYVQYRPGLYDASTRFVVEVMDYPNSLSYVQKSIDLINRDSRKKILITTSPVPLQRTFSGDDVIIANTYSKSVLRAVAGAIATTNEGVDYFPSYESVMLSKRIEVWKDDLVHVEPSFIGRIMRRVTESYVRSGASAPVQESAFRFIGHVSHQQWPQAAAAWTEIEASSIPPATAEFDSCAAEFHEHEGNREAARAHLMSALDSITSVGPMIWDLHLRCAVVAERLGDSELSARHRNRALAAAGLNQARWRLWIPDLIGRRSEGLPWAFAQAEASHSSCPDMLVYIAQMHEMAGAPDQAERVYRKALELVPDHGLALAGYGRLFLKTDRIEAATQLAMLLSNSTSPEWEPLGRFASELVHLKQFAPAEPLLRKLVKVKPHHGRGHLLLAHCIYNISGASEALPHAAEAARLGPSPKAEKLLAQLERETRRAAVPAVE